MDGDHSLITGTRDAGGAAGSSNQRSPFKRRRDSSGKLLHSCRSPLFHLLMQSARTGLGAAKVVEGVGAAGKGTAESDKGPAVASSPIMDAKSQVLNGMLAHMLRAYILIRLFRFPAT